VEEGFLAALKVFYKKLSGSLAQRVGVLFVVQHREGVHACCLRKRGPSSNGYQEEQSCRSEYKGPEVKRRNVEQEALRDTRSKRA